MINFIQIGLIKVPFKVFNKWIIALRSGKYYQTRGILQDEKGFCCLGVACHLFIPKDRQELRDQKYLTGVLPDMQWSTPNWLINISTDFSKKTGKELFHLNDIEYLTFDEIADCLESVYILGVLN